MKITKAVYLSFVSSNIATSTISIPFTVSSIHVKGISYDPANIPNIGTARYGTISSDLVDQQPLGIFYNDSTYGFTSSKDIHLTLYTPKTINSTYTFFLTNDAGAPYFPVNNGTDQVILILEFNDASEK
jgi:hypothetical protein